MRKANRDQTGIIFNIQKFSVHDGPGIRTVVFFKGCPLHCLWCSNPESQLPQTQIIWNPLTCGHCNHCITHCPQNAITLHHDRIHIDMQTCTGCQACVSQCPKKALEVEGEVKNVQEILDVVMQDLVFYEEGGGITLSGGEFLSQPDFALELLLGAKEEGLHTCCETTGFAAPDVFERVLPYIDELLFDVKHWDKERHQMGTGVTNERSLANLKRAVELNKNVLPRIPVIPNFNDSLQDAIQFASLLHALCIQRCQLLCFHQFGENKYSRLQLPYAYEGIASLHQEDLKEYLTIFHKQGIDAFF